MHIHIVKPGDSVWTLSRYFGVPSQAIVEGNRLIHPDRLVVGQTLVIPIDRQPSGVVQKPTVETNGYIDPRITRGRSAQAIDNVGEFLG